MRQERLYTLVGLFVGGAISLTIIIGLYAYDEYIREKVETYVMFFRGSLAGLNVASDVTYRGVKIGEVKRIEVTENEAGNKIKIPVYVQFFVERTFVGNQSPIQLLISKGYVAKITKPNYLTGVASIDIEETTLPQSYMKAEFRGYPIFPTNNEPREYTSLDEAFRAAKKAFEDISDFVHSAKVNDAFDATKNMALSMDRLVTHLHELIPPTFTNFNHSLREVSALAGNLDHLMPPIFIAFGESLKQVDKSLNQFSTLATNLDEVVLPTFNTFNQSMKDVSAAANATQNLTDYLLRYPESLLRGRK
ncbi:MlaD family protein [Legionella maceachernii]|uniref:Putative transmembrane protein n=1 Tax=Legionella maceachernii TaxID=466 RepID=A0A0W0W108_9GAMM|nr:MlaD family protein [Legionella maceachernii]KTD25854.1 putative transmembrane protein [Legionella maceachernii]SJZ46993.1 paraquat-inducible protein B [Legionella maceachernii]SUP03948.1 paraquat-inducible protein B [Legionella maceachernii]